MHFYVPSLSYRTRIFARTLRDKRVKYLVLKDNRIVSRYGKLFSKRVAGHIINDADSSSILYLKTFAATCSQEVARRDYFGSLRTLGFRNGPISELENGLKVHETHRLAPIYGVAGSA